MNDPARLRQLNHLLEQALALPEHERQPWLRRLPLELQGLAPRLAAMLARAGIESDDFLQRPLEELLPPPDEHEDDSDAPGDIVGPYRLIRELGAGGMARVWLAVRNDGSLQRQVALKLPRQGWLPGRARRMALERDILAALEHPSIARLYEAGASEQGRPWLAMEYVDGRPIDQHCRDQALGVRARLQLVLQVMRAVAYAHERLTVHRDLKPNNILVTPQGQVRLLDFGVAKLLAAENVPSSPLTQAGSAAYTRDYASPEQIRGGPLTVGTDVYSMGVVLYELLTGERPYRLRHDSPAALEEAILGTEITPPSQRAPQPLAREMRGDLDKVLVKALKKDPAQRYANIDAFADDLQRVLDRRPVSARGDGFGYRLTRFVQRNTWPVAAGAALALAVAAGAAAALWQAQQAAVERDRALQRLARNEAVSEFLELMFTQGVPESQGQVVRQMLERSSAYVDQGYGSQPEHRAAMRLMLSIQYVNMAEPGKGLPLLTQARQLLHDSPDRDLRAQVDCAAAQAYSLAGRHAEAVAALQPWLDAPDLDHNIAAACLLRRAERAAASHDAVTMLNYSERALQRLRQARLPSLPLQATALGQRASALPMLGRGAEADQAYQQAMDTFAAIGREHTPDAVILRGNWASTQLSAGEVQRGLAQCELAMRLQAEHGGGQASTPLLANCALGSELLARNEEAHSRYQQVLVAVEAAGDLQSKVFALCGLASVATQQQQFERAQSLLDQAGAVIRSADFAPGHTTRLRQAMVQARLDIHRGRPQPARAALDGVIRVFEERRISSGPQAAAHRLRADAWRGAGDLVAAATDAREALRIAQSAQAGRPHSMQTGLAWLALARVQQAAGDIDGRLGSARQALAHLEAAAGREHPEALAARRLMGEGN